MNRETSTRPPAILLGGQASTLSVARSLGRAGVEVTVLGHAQSSPVRRSRWCSRFVDVGAGEGLHERWLAWLETGPVGAVVLPCTDAAIELIARNRELLERRYRVFEANDEVALAFLDKERTYELARAAGVRAPETVPLRTDADVEAAAERLGFPCGLKPSHPVPFRKVYGLATKLFVIRSAEELRARHEETSRHGLEMLATELVPGADDSIRSWTGYLVEDGELIFQTTRRKLRQYPPHFGIGSYFEASWHPEVAEIAARLVRSAGALGLVSVELKRHARDGGFVLMECNYRFSNANELLSASGVDAALVTYERAAGLPVTPPGAQRDGTRLLYPTEDFRSFRQLRRDRELTLPAYLRSLAHPTRFAYFRLDDPLPSVGHAAQAVSRRAAAGGARALRALRARAARAAAPAAGSPPEPPR